MKEFIEYFTVLNWQTVCAFFFMGWYLKHEFNLRFDKLEKKMETLDERIFQISTGKTLAQAIIDEKIKG